MIKCERQAYEDFCKKHPKVGGLWKTPFPYLDKLDEIFGVDRANGITSELPEDSIHYLEKENINLNDDNDDEEFVSHSPSLATTDVPSQAPPTRKINSKEQ
ncbi:DNA-directed RNA polymerase subunit beta [Bienertia sinuspersici]